MLPWRPVVPMFVLRVRSMQPTDQPLGRGTHHASGGRYALRLGWKFVAPARRFALSSYALIKLPPLHFAAFPQRVSHYLLSDRTIQPVEDAEGNALCWNGEIFGGDLAVPEGANDTCVLLEALARLDGPQIVSQFARIEGPWAFVYWQVRWSHRSWLSCLDSRGLRHARAPYGSVGYASIHHFV